MTPAIAFVGAGDPDLLTPKAVDRLANDLPATTPAMFVDPVDHGDQCLTRATIGVPAEHPAGDVAGAAAFILYGPPLVDA